MNKSASFYIGFFLIFFTILIVGFYHNLDFLANMAAGMISMLGGYLMGKKT